MKVPLLPSVCSLPALWGGGAGNAFFPSPRPLYFLFSPPSFFLFAFVSRWLVPLPSSFLNSLSHPRTPPPPSLLPSISPTLPLVLVCALGCHGGGGGGGCRLIGGLDGHLILALPHNVGMCDFFKIRFPRWVLSSAMASTIMRVCTVVLLSLPRSLSLFMFGFCPWILFAALPPVAVVGEKSSRGSKSLRAMAAVNASQQVTVKCQTVFG